MDAGSAENNGLASQARVFWLKVQNAYLELVLEQAQLSVYLL